MSSPKIMGILNITPDSFYSGSRVQSSTAVLQKVESMLSDGADIIDLGAHSSRPRSEAVSEQDELKRLDGMITAIIKEFPNTIISIDTFRSEVAKRAIDDGASIINDISAGRLDKNMFDLVASAGLPYIMMHMRGTPGNMGSLTDYDNLLVEMHQYFQERIAKLTAMGVSDLIIDPGFGFAKTLDQNYEIVKNLEYFQVLAKPILIGVSRKSMIFKLLEQDPSDALNGTSSLNTIALLRGANILRVHDVKEAKEVIQLVNKSSR